ncbi:MAG: thermonuclease family protein [Myxococcota bacterium]
MAVLPHVACALLAAGVAVAHPGGRDRQGCHVERATGGRHCHGAKRPAAATPAFVASAPTPAAPAGAPEQVVRRAVDGDTVELTGGVRVRLIGVDTPEMKDARPEVRLLAKRAAVFLDDLVAGKRVRLEYDRERRDRYGRTLAYVYLADGRCVNAEIIRQGFGFAYTRFPFRYRERFREHERQSRVAGLGLWAPQASGGEPARRRATASDLARSRMGEPAMGRSGLHQPVRRDAREGRQVPPP